MAVQFVDFNLDYGSEVEKMILELYQEDAAGPEVTPEKIQRTFKELGSREDKGKIIVLKDMETVIGYGIIIFFWSNQHGGELVVFDELYIKPPWRNKGFATQFFEYIFREYGEKAGAFKLEVTKTNEGAKSLYERLGFKLSKDLIMIATRGDGSCDFCG